MVKTIQSGRVLASSPAQLVGSFEAQLFRKVARRRTLAVPYIHKATLPIDKAKFCVTVLLMLLHILLSFIFGTCASQAL